jgi:hypothetical protein
MIVSAVGSHPKQEETMIRVETRNPDGTVTVQELDSPELHAAWEALQEVVNEIDWCGCEPDEEIPEYYEYDDGAHGWECGRCGGLLQTG